MQKIFEVRDENYIISTTVSRLDVNIIHYYLSEESYWARGVLKNIVEKSITNSLCFVLFYNNEQIAFPGLVTDKATLHISQMFLF